MSDLLEPGGGLLSMVKPGANLRLLHETPVSGLQRKREPRPRSETLVMKVYHLRKPGEGTSGEQERNSPEEEGIPSHSPRTSCSSHRTGGEGPISPAFAHGEWVGGRVRSLQELHRLGNETNNGSVLYFLVTPTKKVSVQVSSSKI